jgi:hypothetical protein
MTKNEEGFSTVELLTTLIIAAMFVTMFYQLYSMADTVTAQSNLLVSANYVTYGKLQEYEDKSFSNISTPGGTVSTDVEDFSASLPSILPKPISAKVKTALLTPTLKAVNVKATYGTGGTQRIIEYTTYIQQSGLGR